MFWRMIFISRAMSGKTKVFFAVSCWTTFNSSNLLVIESDCADDSEELESLNDDVCFLDPA